MRKTIAAAALTALALAAPVAAQPAPECTYKVPKKMRLAPAPSSGHPGRCHLRGTDRGLEHRPDRVEEAARPLGRPPQPRRPGVAKSDILTFTEAGTQSLRVEIVPKKFFRHYAKTKLRILLGIQMEPDQPYHTSVDSGKVITLIR
jgi:hypothetical protein